MDRREFAGTLGAAAALPRRPAAGRARARLARIGVQLYSVRGLMQRDFEGTLAEVARIGFKEVEFAGYFGRTPAQVREVLRRHRLAAPATHTDATAVAGDWRRVLDTAVATGHQYVVVAWTPQEMRRTLDDWRRIADLYNRAAAEARAAGLRFAYHNHSYEFERMDGQLPYDVLVDRTDPDLVKLELDLYWITEGGQDPLAYFSRCAGRIELVHVKDRTAAGRMADVGAGAIDWRAILARREQAGIRHYFVEHDEPADPIASITASYRYLRALRF